MKMPVGMIGATLPSLVESILPQPKAAIPAPKPVAESKPKAAPKPEAKSKPEPEPKQVPTPKPLPTPKPEPKPVEEAPKPAPKPVLLAREGFVSTRTRYGTAVEIIEVFIDEQKKPTGSVLVHTRHNNDVSSPVCVNTSDLLQPDVVPPELTGVTWGTNLVQLTDREMAAEKKRKTKESKESNEQETTSS